MTDQAAPPEPGQPEAPKEQPAPQDPPQDKAPRDMKKVLIIVGIIVLSLCLATWVAYEWLGFWLVEGSCSRKWIKEPCDFLLGKLPLGFIARSCLKQPNGLGVEYILIHRKAEADGSLARLAAKGDAEVLHEILTAIRRSTHLMHQQERIVKSLCINSDKYGEALQEECLVALTQAPYTEVTELFSRIMANGTHERRWAAISLFPFRRLWEDTAGLVDVLERVSKEDDVAKILCKAYWSLIWITDKWKGPREALVLVEEGLRSGDSAIKEASDLTHLPASISKLFHDKNSDQRDTP